MRNSGQLRRARRMRPVSRGRHSPVSLADRLAENQRANARRSSTYEKQPADARLAARGVDHGRFQGFAAGRAEAEFGFMARRSSSSGPPPN